MRKYQFYRVGQEKFSNKFLAFIRSQETGLHLKFDFFEKEFDQANWSKDPDLTWDQLLDIRANQIANMKKPIVLGFSGGTDSYTIYQVFKRNNIKIDAVFLRYKDDPKEKDMYENVLSFIENEKSKYGFKTILIKDDSRFFDQVYSNEEWWLSSEPVRINFSVAVGLQDIEHFYGYDTTIDNDFVLVMGMDKPRIKIIDNKMYSYLQDTTFNNYCHDRHEYFFSSPNLPELHIKQSYMLGKYIRHLSETTNKPISYFENIHNPLFFNYQDFAYNGCGRFGDLANSVKQKILNRECSLYIDNDKIFYNGRSEDALIGGINSESMYSKNYINGLKSMRADSKLKNIFTDEKNYYSIIDIDSKYYRLNC